MNLLTTVTFNLADSQIGFGNITIIFSWLALVYPQVSISSISKFLSLSACPIHRYTIVLAIQVFLKLKNTYIMGNTGLWIGNCHFSQTPYLVRHHGIVFLTLSAHARRGLQ